MKSFAVILIAGLASTAAFGQAATQQATMQANRSAGQGAPEIDTDEQVIQSETLRYSVNWPSGLSLGEAQIGSSKLKTSTGERWKLSYQLEAAIPGFNVIESVKSSTTGDYCTLSYEKKATRGKKKVSEKTEFDLKKHTAVRATENGGKSEISTSSCAKDALAFLFFVRRELIAGRLPAPQQVFYGAPYQTRVEFKGTQSMRVGENVMNVDRLIGTLKGPASESTFEMYFAKDAVRTPVVLSVPLTIGKFSMELVR